MNRLRRLSRLLVSTALLGLLAGCTPDVPEDPEDGGYPKLLATGKGIYAPCFFGVYQHGPDGWKEVVCTDLPWPAESDFGTVSVPAIGSPTLGWTRRVWESHHFGFKELRRIDRETGADELLLSRFTSSKYKEVPRGFISAPATLEDGSILAVVRDEGAPSGRLLHFGENSEEEWVGTALDPELVERIGADTVLLTVSLEGIRWWATASEGLLVPAVPTESVGDLVDASVDGLLFEDGEQECAAWQNGSLRRPDVGSLDSPARRTIGWLPGGAVLIMTEEGAALWDAEDGSVPEVLSGLPLDIKDRPLGVASGATMLMEELGDGRERPGFFTDGVWIPCEGGAVERPSGPILLEDDNSEGVVYAEAKPGPANGTVYVCSPDGSVTQLRHPDVRMRVPGAVPHW